MRGAETDYHGGDYADGCRVWGECRTCPLPECVLTLTPRPEAMAVIGVGNALATYVAVRARGLSPWRPLPASVVAAIAAEQGRHPRSVRRSVQHARAALGRVAQLST